MPAAIAAPLKSNSASGCVLRAVMTAAVAATIDAIKYKCEA
jgi:hypothetical protein